MVAKAARTSYYEMAVELGYVTPFKILEAFHGSHIPQSARAIVSGGAPSALEIHSRSISSSDIYLSLVGGEEGRRCECRHLGIPGKSYISRLIPLLPLLYLFHLVLLCLLRISMCQPSSLDGWSSTYTERSVTSSGLFFMQLPQAEFFLCKSFNALG